ncbi:hypothetical protein [uncultured Paracoccus sp.]|uniref:hypothetical protein n=1 Tax=uncultured Paracoccus sp. TaxID=189685 RepID=UPI00261A6D21|nr:hypothetical protein [uncultured Paracoccus sp.]
MTFSLTISRLALCTLLAVGATSAAAQSTPAAKPADASGAADTAAMPAAETGGAAAADSAASGDAAAAETDAASADAAPADGSVAPVTDGGDAAAAASTDGPAAGGAGENSYRKVVDGAFDDVAFSVEQAITNAGLVIDSTSHVGEMLSRTKGDIGGAQDLYTQADVFSFCSAIESRKAMEADITNIEFCPYTVFVYETVAEPGKITIGHNIYPGESMAGVNSMLTALVDTAAD